MTFAAALGSGLVRLSPAEPGRLLGAPWDGAFTLVGTRQGAHLDFLAPCCPVGSAAAGPQGPPGAQERQSAQHRGLGRCYFAPQVPRLGGRREFRRRVRPCKLLHLWADAAPLALETPKWWRKSSASPCDLGQSCQLLSCLCFDSKNWDSDRNYLVVA